MNQLSRKIINDPVYGFITIDDPLIFDIIAHPYYQRLRRIHQEPGALHSLGCVRDDDGELRCTCTPLVLRGDDDED